MKMDSHDTVEEQLRLALVKLRGYKMGKWEKRAQAIDFTVGNLMLDRPHYDEWMVAKWAAESYDEGHL